MDYSRPKMILIDGKGNVYIPEGIITFFRSKMTQIAIMESIPPSPKVIYIFYVLLLMHLNTLSCLLLRNIS